eukprot:14682572-Alexandrium_andersonii.AAC.1
MGRLAWVNCRGFFTSPSPPERARSRESGEYGISSVPAGFLANSQAVSFPITRNRKGGGLLKR